MTGPQRLSERSTRHLKRHIPPVTAKPDNCRSATIFPKLWPRPALTRSHLLELPTVFRPSRLCCSGLPALQVDLLQATTGWKVMRTRQSSDPTASRAAMISTLAYHSWLRRCATRITDMLPEEVYLVLSPGRFQHGSSSWFEPGLGGTLYNEPNIKHAMASGDAPLLAIWCLWTG